MKHFKILLCFLLLLSTFSNVKAEEIPESNPNIEVTPEVETTLEPIVTPSDTPNLDSDSIPNIEETSIPNIEPTPTTEIEAPIEKAYELDLDGIKFKVEDSGMTVDQAIEILNENSMKPTRASAQLKRDARIASFQGPLGTEYISQFSLSGRPAYCIEPYVLVILDGNGNGPIYDSIEPSQLSTEQKLLIGRIMWYGYGHPLIGSSPEAYLATSFLIWQITAPDDIGNIMSTAKWCTPIDHACSATGGAVNVTDMMNNIMNIVNNHDKVPSFGNEWHGTNKYEMTWGETLRLTDTLGILNWFNEWSEESHNGLNIKVEGSDLLVDVDNLYYEGWNSPNGKTLTFKRKDAEHAKFMNGILLWISGANQKIMTGSSVDPSPQFTLSFKMKTADLSINKQDEYYLSNNFTPGTTYIAGWVEDPERQYKQKGLNDPNWKVEHPVYDEDIKYDLYGDFNYVNAKKTYYPIMNEAGTDVAKFTVGADGVLHLDGLLPMDKEWWIREYDVTNPYQVDPRPFKMKTGEQNLNTNQTFVNLLRDVELDVIKKDAEDQDKKINGATFQIFEIGTPGKPLDLSKNPTMAGPGDGIPSEAMPGITLNQIYNNLPNPKVGQTFYFNDFEFKILEITDTNIKVSATPHSLRNDPPITIDQIPSDAKIGMSFSVESKDGEMKEYQIVDILMNSILIKYDDLKSYVEFTNSTTPSLNDIQGMLMLPGTYFEYNGQAYTVKLVDPFKVTAYKAYTYEINKNNKQITYDDIPSNIKVGDEFVIDNDNYKVTSINPHRYILDAWSDVEVKAYAPSMQELDKITIETTRGGQTVKQELTQDISKEIAMILPMLKEGETINYHGFEIYISKVDFNNATVEGILKTVQTVCVDIPVPLKISDLPKSVTEVNMFEITNIINPIYTLTSEDGSKYLVTDQNINKLNDDGSMTLITDGSVPGYLDIIQGNSSINGGACEEPYDIMGCPIGTQRTVTKFNNIDIPYLGLQYDDLEAFLGYPTTDLVVDSTIDHNGVVYTVVKPVDVAGAIPSITLKWNDGKEHKIVLESGKNITSITEKEEVVSTFTVDERTDKEIVVNHVSAKTGNNHQMIGKSIHIKSTDNNNDLITYAQLTSELKLVGDQVTTERTREFGIGDDFDKDGINYTLLKISENNIGTVGYCQEDNPPFTYQEVQDKFKYATEIEEDGKKFTVHLENYDDEVATVITDQDGNTYHYWRYQIFSDTYQSDVEDAKDNHYVLDVAIPEITWDDYFNNANGLKEGDFFKANEKDYKIIRINADTSVVVKNVKSNKEFTLIEVDPYATTFETKRIFFVEKGSTINLDQVLNKPANKKVSYELSSTAKASLSGNELTADDISYFQVQMTGNVFKIPFTYNRMKTENPDSLLNVGDIVSVNEVEYLITEVNNISVDKLSYTIKAADGNEFAIENAPVDFTEIPGINKLEKDDEFTVKQVTYLVTDIYKVDGVVQTISYHEKDKKDVYQLYKDTTSPSSGYIYGTYTFVITTSNNGEGPVKTVDGLPMYEGTTGKQDVRITDPTNHNVPIPFYPISISTDPDGLDEVKKGYSDAWGKLSVDDLEPGIYYYSQPGMFFRKEFVVYASDQLDGELKISDLKWGRKYMACEVGLPDGYDYQGDVCFELTMDLATSTNTKSTNVMNKLRRIDLSVYKVDHDDKSILLNGAVFTVRDITDEGVDLSSKDESTFPNKIKFEDLPNSFKIGDEIKIWRDDVNDIKINYEVIANDQDTVTIRDEKNASYIIPKVGMNPILPLAYSDILKNIKDESLLTPGYKFTANKKEEGNIQTYKITQINIDPNSIVWDPTDDNYNTDDSAIIDVTVININDTSKTPIILKSNYFNLPEIGTAEDLGIHVSGSIYLRLTKQQQREPLIWNDITVELGNDDSLLTSNIKLGATLNKVSSKTVLAPLWSEIKNVESLVVNDEFTFNDILYTVKTAVDSTATTKLITLSYDGGKSINVTEVSGPQSITVSITTVWTIINTMTDYNGIHYEDIPGIDSLVAGDTVLIDGVTFKVDEITLDKIVLQDATHTDALGNLVFDGDKHTYVANQNFNEHVIGVSLRDNKGNTFYCYPGQVATTEEVGDAGRLVRISDTADGTNVIQTAITDYNGEIIVSDLADGTYYSVIDNTIKEHQVEKGKIELPNLKYGHNIEICEIKSPLGYIVGDACQVIIPEAEFNQTRVNNYRTNKKIVWWEKGGRRVRIRKMGN